MHFLAALLTAFLATAASGPVQGGADGILAQLSNLRLDKNQIYSIRDITLRRDALAISFNRGAIAFLEPVAGRVTGAVFVGSGEILSIPPGSAEKLQLFKFTGSPILNERFDAGLFRFTDDTYSEILRQYEDRAHEEVRAEDLEALLPWEDNLGERARLLNFRLLKDLIGNDERPLFFAELRGETMGWFDAVYDQRMAEEVTVLTAGRDSFLTDIWLSFNRRSEARDPESFAHEDPSPVDVLSYDIDLTIEPDTLLEAVTKLDLRARVSGERVLSFDMTPALRVSDVMLDDEAVPFFQYEESALDPFYEGLDRFVVVLPSATEEGAEMSLEFRYSGSILEDRGEGIYFVSERSLWYPSVGPQDPARFDLTFHFPASGELVATGSLLDERTDGELKHSRWTSGREFFVAGFNFGDFAIESHEDGPVPVFVCLNNDVETIFKEIESRRALEKELALRAAANRRRNRLANETVLVSPDFRCIFDAGAGGQHSPRRSLDSGVFLGTVRSLSIRPAGCFAVSGPLFTRLAVSALCFDIVVLHARTTQPARTGAATEPDRNRIRPGARDRTSVVRKQDWLEELPRSVDRGRLLELRRSHVPRPQTRRAGTSGRRARRCGNTIVHKDG